MADPRACSAIRSAPAAGYERHRPDETLLFKTLQQHWRTFLSEQESDVGATQNHYALEVFRQPILDESNPCFHFGDRFPRHPQIVCIAAEVSPMKPVCLSPMKPVRTLRQQGLFSLHSGTRLGWIAPGAPWPLRALDERGADRSTALFVADSGELRTRIAVVPIMMTTDVAVARSDCLFYAVHQRQ